MGTVGAALLPPELHAKGGILQTIPRHSEYFMCTTWNHFLIITLSTTFKNHTRTLLYEINERYKSERLHDTKQLTL